MIEIEKIEITKIDKNKGYIFESKILKDELLIYFKDDKYYAVSSFCPHFGGPLEFAKKEIRCYWHGWKFDLKSHKCKNRQVNCKLKDYKIVIKKSILEISNGN